MNEARRYEPLLKIASGATAAVYVGTATGALGFRQLVAIKIPHAHLADDAAFRAALLEEARIAARLHHANVVDVRDVEVDDGGVQLVMDYVEGASLSELIRAWTQEPPPRPAAVAIRIVLDACEGLRALHELGDEEGTPLGLVHRDVSPANILVGLDGVARIADFGLAKSLLAVERTASEGVLRGKLGYMAPEYVRGKPIDQRLDVFAMGVVLWEALARRRLFRGDNDGDTIDRIQRLDPPPLAETSAVLGSAIADLDAIVTRALAKDPAARFPSIAALSAELEKVVRTHDLTATHGDVRDAFAPSLRAALDDRRKRIQSATVVAPSSPPPSPGAGPPRSASSIPAPPSSFAPSTSLAPRPSVAPPSASAPSSVSASSVSASSVSAPLPVSVPLAVSSLALAPAGASVLASGRSSIAAPSRRSLAVIFAFFVAIVVGAAGVVLLVPAAAPSSTRASPRSIPSDVEPLSGERQARASASYLAAPAPSSPVAILPSASSSLAVPPGSSPPSPRASAPLHGLHTAPRPLPASRTSTDARASPDEPGKKLPRPNPYGPSPPPR